MKKSNLIAFSILVCLSFLFSSCAAIVGIFKAGMDFGIFLVGIITVIIIAIILKSGKKN